MEEFVPARDAMFVLMFMDSDGYTYSCESLVGIFWSQEEAETALLRVVECGERWRALERQENAALLIQDHTKRAEVREKMQEMGGWGAWRPSEKIDDYEIKRVEIGEILL